MNSNWQSRKLSNKVWKLSSKSTKLLPSDIKQHVSEHGNMVDLQGNIPEEYMRVAHELYSGLPDTFKKALQDRGLSIQLADQYDKQARDFLKERNAPPSYMRNIVASYPGAVYTEPEDFPPFVHKFIPQNKESVEANIPQFTGHIAHELGHSIDFLLHHLYGLNKNNKDISSYLRNAFNAREAMNKVMNEPPIHKPRLVGNSAYYGNYYDPIIGNEWHKENFADLSKFLLPLLSANRDKPFHENLHSFGQKVWGQKYPYTVKNYLNTLLFLHAALGGEYPGRFFHYDYYKEPYGIKLQ